MLDALTPAHFTAASWIGAAVIVALAALVRGWPFAVFATVLLGIHNASATTLFAWAGPSSIPFAYLQLAMYVHFVGLVWARARPWPWRAAITVPGLFFQAGSMLAVPWAITAALGFEPTAFWLPYVIALIGTAQSVRGKAEDVDVVLDGIDVDVAVRRHPAGDHREERPLNVVQITDPHLGPFMSVRRLKKICERAVARDPDLILLTGDFLTMESQKHPEHLAEALAPLRELEGRTFACLGNHDLEAPVTVADGLESAGVRLLIDDAATVETEAGPVQIVGADFVWRGRAEHLDKLCAAHPRKPGHLRIMLLHDPGAFRHLPAGEADLVFSGHTHGGQVGLLSLGLRWTIMQPFTKIPDYGFWARGPDRMYVHRGQGHYGFPLRIGVPNEEGLIRVHRAGAFTR